MFDPQPGPRLFAVPPGADFPAVLAARLRQLLTPLPPEAQGRVLVLVNTRRLQRRLRSLFAVGPAALLPRIRLITELDAGPEAVAAAVPALRRRLELAQLVARLIDSGQTQAPRAALFGLADSLASLMAEMQGEGVSPARVAALDLTHQSEHWARSLAFLNITARFFGPEAAPDPEARQRQVIERLVARWAAAPPDTPLILAGSTGSRGTTALLMQAVARLPQGAVVLPGFDTDLTGPVWAGMGDAMTGEDHPQFQFGRFCEQLGVSPLAVPIWGAESVPNAGRNRLVSLSMRPAPVTDAWMTEGPLLPDLAGATADLTLVEAASPRVEALAIALILRQAAEAGTPAALITPDRGLTRQVTAALDRWGIVPDDSAGRPLALSAPGRLLRHVADLFGRRLTAEALLVLLKHPLVAGGGARGDHLRLARDLELRLRRYGPAFPSGDDLRRWAAGTGDIAAVAWAGWLADWLAGLAAPAEQPLTAHVAAHLAQAEALAAGPGGAGAGGLWQAAAGAEAQEAMAELAREAGHGGVMTAHDYAHLITDTLNRREVRDAAVPHPGVMIWGTLEARVQGADLVILGGLNDGSWPQLPPPDPWLNRQMRQDAGLLLPERQIGLSAHDYQQAIAAPRVVLTRALRSAEAESVPSRWLNRLTNLMGGLAAQGGPAALTGMRARGAVWLQQAAALDATPVPVAPEPRPAPSPPLAARPTRLSVTEISILIRDPYAIYAKHVLRLAPLDPLRATADARERGRVLHRIVERHVRGRVPDEPPAAARARLLAIAAAELEADIPWPASRALWFARLARVADWFVAQEAARSGQPVFLEGAKGAVVVPGLGFTLTARPDRIDLLPDGTAEVLDYKTGDPPSKDRQRNFDKQLLLQAAMLERGAFAGVAPVPVSTVTYVGLGPKPKLLATPLDPGVTDTIWTDFVKLLSRYGTRAQGYTARRAVHLLNLPGDYDHLSRFGEWEMSAAAPITRIGPEDAL